MAERASVALFKAEALLRRAENTYGVETSSVLAAGSERVAHTSVVCSPGGQAFQLLSPPDRPVPAGLWDLLAACEQTLLCEHDPASVVARSGKRRRLDGGDSAKGAHTSQQAEAHGDSSQESHQSNIRREVSSQEAPHFLESSFTRWVDPLIPPVRCPHAI